MAQTNVALIGKALYIPLNVKVPLDKLVVSIIHPNGQFLKDAPLREKEFGEYIIEFLADEIGEYVLNILIGGELKTQVPVLVQNSTTSIEMRDTEEATTYVDSEFEYTLELPADVPVNTIKAAFVHDLTGEPEHTNIIKADKNNFILKFIPSKEGKYTASVEISGQGIIGEIKVVALPPPKISLKITKGGNGRCSVGSEHVYGLSVEGMDVNGIGAMVQIPQGEVHAATIKITGNNTLDIIYVPQAPGEYIVELVYEGGSFSGPLKLIAE